MRQNSIYVKFAKSLRKTVALNYSELNLANRQARLSGRYALQPDIDLSQFRRRAVIDWVDLGFWLKRNTQAIHVRNSVVPILGESCFTRIVPIEADEERSQTGPFFSVTMQEPTIAQMLRTERKLSEDFGLEADGIVRAVEISVDFRPVVPSAEARTKIFTALQRHHSPPEQILESRPDRPRFTWGPGAANTAFVLPISAAPGAKDYLAISNDRDLQPVGDANYYLGRKGGPVMWRIMDKELDQQNHRLGTVRHLSEIEKRVRMEVTLETEELRRLGVVFTEDLRKSFFDRLQHDYFEFRLPTFAREGAGLTGQITKVLEANRRDKFLTTGILGLREMDRALKRRRERHRPALIRHLQERKLKVKPEDRNGRGPSGSTLAYKELNKAFEVALRNLREREERALVRPQGGICP